MLTKASFALLCNLVVLVAAHPTLNAEAIVVGPEPRIVAGSFVDSDRLASPLALWLERGQARIVSNVAEAGSPFLQLIAAEEPAQVCLLFGAPGARVGAVDLRLKLADSVGGSTEILEWELAGVPLRLERDENGRWGLEFSTGQNHWQPLPPRAAETSLDEWHALRLEFAPDHGTLRFRWGDGAFTPWSATNASGEPLLVIAGGRRVGILLDDIAYSVDATAENSAASNEVDVAARARAAALRQEIAVALDELVREGGCVRRHLPSRPTVRMASPSAARAGSRRLDVLTPLENEHSAN